MKAITTNYEPKEWLALKINYCRMVLKKLPDASIYFRSIKGSTVPVVEIDNHRYRRNSKEGTNYFKLAEKREQYEATLEESESKWYSTFKGPIPKDICPRKVVRKYNNGNGEMVTLDKEFFDSLKNDADPNHPESKKYFFNGIYYRSVAEKEIAEFYTMNGIPFKYEPEIWIAGMNKPINPDFVIYIKEIDSCKIHEHLGLMSFVTYLRNTKNKYVTYIEAGLIPDLDILFTYDTDDMPFDIRTMWPRLNAIVYSSLFAK